MSTAHARQDWALYFAAMGWHVFPLRPGSKTPTGHREADCPRTGTCASGHRRPEQYATTDADLIRSAWGRAGYNIGIATGPSGLCVIDLDLPKPGDTGPDGATALAALAAERGGPLPPTYTVTTPSGGRHLYYASPPGARLRSTRRHIAEQVDTRAWGGYVVAPGSVLAEGGYELEDDTDPVDLPGWLVQANQERPPTALSGPVEIRCANTDRYAAAALHGEAERVREAPPGRHNEVLSTAAYTIGRKVGGGLLDHATARAELLAAAAHLVTAACGCTPHEIARVTDAGLAAGARNPVARHTTARKEVA